MKLIIANQMFEPHVKALGLRWDDGDIHEDDLDAWHDAFNDLDFQDLFLCGDEDAKTFFLISDGDYELLENFLEQFDVIHGDNDVVTGLPYPEQLTFDCGPEDVEAFLKENRSEWREDDLFAAAREMRSAAFEALRRDSLAETRIRDTNVVTTSGGTWEYCFDDREKELLEWALETSRDQTLKKAPRRAEYTTETPLAFDEVTVLLKKIKETGSLGYW